MTMRAAHYMGIPPWEVEQMSVRWRDRAVVASMVEEQAAEDRQRLMFQETMLMFMKMR